VYGVSGEWEESQARENLFGSRESLEGVLRVIVTSLRCGWDRARRHIPSLLSFSMQLWNPYWQCRQRNGGWGYQCQAGEIGDECFVIQPQSLAPACVTSERYRPWSSPRQSHSSRKPLAVSSVIFGESGDVLGARFTLALFVDRKGLPQHKFPNGQAESTRAISNTRTWTLLGIWVLGSAAITRAWSRERDR
jgi:hypothetical protein